jgi:ribosomal-protein-alanine N-acetyltransferase
MIAEDFKIETERLLLRRFIEEDCSALLRIQSNPIMTKFTPDEPWIEIEDATNFLRFVQSLYNEEDIIEGFRYFFAVVEKCSNQVIGYCGLGGPEFDRTLTEVFYSIDHPYWGKGYATETTTALLHYGFEQLDLNKIVGFAEKENLASLRVLEKSGLKRISSISGLRFQHDYFNGECFFELDKNDWVNQKDMNKKGTIYFVEGLPGSGKTTISNWLHNILDANFFTEDTPNYPNDFSAIAGMTMDIYTDLSKRFPLLNEFLFEYDSIKYVNIRHIEMQYPNEEELICLLYQWEFGDEFNTNVSLPHYMTFSLGMIHKWLDTLDRTSDNIIMDSVWLQNPINELVFRNADEQAVLGYCELFAEVFKEFNLRCIYLKRNTVVQSVEFASNVKGVSWTNRVAELISKTPYGLAHNLHGLNGMVQYFTVRKQIEEKVLLQGIMKNKDYLIENNNWDQICEQIRSDFSI